MKSTERERCPTCGSADPLYIKTVGGPSTTILNFCPDEFHSSPPAPGEVGMGGGRQGVSGDSPSLPEPIRKDGFLRHPSEPERDASSGATAALRVLVCGARNVSMALRVFRRLGQLPPNVVLIEGGASGIDRQARGIAEDRGWKVETFEADWKGLGKKAGPVRNQRMIDEGEPDLVIAFPSASSIGTWDMVARARVAGIPVEVIEI